MFFKRNRFMNIALIIILFSVYLLGCKTAKSVGREDADNPVEIEGTFVLDRKIPFPKPRSHDGGWIVFHGNQSVLNLDSPRAQELSCYDCHEKVDCIQCHANQAPKDHSNVWRTQTHGFLAGVNRERCQVCHREDYCVRCHRVTEPRSHRGNWIDSHCSKCHFDLTSSFGTSCSVCHKQYPHLSAPHPVSADLDCSVCHQ